MTSGQKFKFFIKPKKPVKTIKVIIIFKKQKEKSSSLNYRSLVDLFLPTPVYAQNWQIAEFILTDEDGDGIYESDIELPEVIGEYIIKTSFFYEDGTTEDIETETLIDPKGYIYTIKDKLEARLPKVVTSLYRFNQEKKQFELWHGQTYDQQNPQTTDKTGEYEFLVPAGRYYFTITAQGYENYQSEEFIAKEGDVITQNVKLTSIKKFNWRWVMISFFIFLVFIIGIFVGLKKNRR